jgi:hypothetical protein
MVQGTCSSKIRYSTTRRLKTLSSNSHSHHIDWINNIETTGSKCLYSQVLYIFTSKAINTEKNIQLKKNKVKNQWVFTIRYSPRQTSYIFSSAFKWNKNKNIYRPELMLQTIVIFIVESFL